MSIRFIVSYLHPRYRKRRASCPQRVAGVAKYLIPIMFRPFVAPVDSDR
jgi:hypothetical protein